MCNKPCTVEEEEGNNDIWYTGSFGSLETAVEAEVPIRHVCD